ncbi:dihydrodipicolinate synthase family protein [Paenibacillus puerhi]|uniref:dihydrodipicolinate synthase family protein n=1 Tax=Paenibacillus puerhi TaxID=2692622 RepID=UPI001F47F981|nr:dihydrodipicolinate synthase family protein [Paenibacillus puerhi]
MRNTRKAIPDGVWPTMITPFQSDGQIDYLSLDQLIEWYIQKGVNGLFAVCQSSEMFFLSLNERVRLAEYIVNRTAGRVPVIASGHIAGGMEEQLEEIGRISAAGPDAFVLVTNRLAGEQESDEVWKSNAERILKAYPEHSFGLYECPYPYKRLLSAELLEWCAASGRFIFLKDTCCDPEMLAQRIRLLQGSPMRLYNANSATLLDSVRLGAAGFSGVMANFHPELYVWLLKHASSHPAQADRLQSFLGMASLVELQLYPVNAKYYLQLEGLPLTTVSRSRGGQALDRHARLLIEQLRDASAWAGQALTR